MRKRYILLLVLIPFIAIVVFIGWYLRFAFWVTNVGDTDMLANVREVTPCCVSPSFPGLSRDISQISKGQSGYFEAGGQNEHVNFIDGGFDWYGTFLAAMQEPSLLDSVESDREIYRFLWLRTFDPPMAIRVEHTITETKLVFTEMSGRGGYSPGAIVRHEERSLPDSQWCSFIMRMDQAGFWKLGEDKEGGAQDGAQWIVEGMKEGRYHLVDRQSPSNGYYRDACLYLLEIARANPEKSGRGIY